MTRLEFVLESERRAPCDGECRGGPGWRAGTLPAMIPGRPGRRGVALEACWTVPAVRVTRPGGVKAVCDSGETSVVDRAPTRGRRSRAPRVDVRRTRPGPRPWGRQLQVLRSRCIQTGSRRHVMTKLVIRLGRVGSVLEIRGGLSASMLDWRGC